MMKTSTLFLIASVLVLSSCMSAQEMLDDGNYNAALERAVKRLQNKPGKVKHLAIAEQAYNAAKADDEARIAELKATGNEANWETIYALYQDLEYRQELVQSLEYTPNNVRFTDYAAERAEAQTRAAEYNYGQGLELMARANRFDARKANERFARAHELLPNYKDVDARISESREAGFTNVLVTVAPAFPYTAPSSVQQDLASLKPSWNRGWVRYHNGQINGLTYHYNAVFTPSEIGVQPEQLGKTMYTRTKTIEKWQPKLDACGNVLKDTTGKVIEEKVCLEITACVTEFTLHKSAAISGTIDYYDLATGERLRTSHFTVEESFEHTWATFTGNRDALSNADCRRIRCAPASAPADWDLINGASDQLRSDFTSLVGNHRGVIK